MLLETVCDRRAPELLLPAGLGRLFRSVNSAARYKEIRSYTRGRRLARIASPRVVLFSFFESLSHPQARLAHKSVLDGYNEK